jgi:hypothetical protein
MNKKRYPFIIKTEKILLFIFVFFLFLLSSKIVIFDIIMAIRPEAKPYYKTGDLFKPYAGEYVLPDEVQEMLKFIRENNLKNFYLSPMLNARNTMSPKEHEIFERIINSAWDSKFDSASKNLFIRNEELDKYKSIKNIKRGNSVSLVIID